jgi:ABC-type lipoprotein release transport system permease subunit
VLAVPLFLWLNAHVDIIPILSLRDGKFYFMSNEDITNNILRSILAIIILFMIINIIRSIYKILKRVKV